MLSGVKGTQNSCHVRNQCRAIHHEDRILPSLWVSLSTILCFRAGSEEGDKLEVAESRRRPSRRVETLALAESWRGWANGAARPWRVAETSWPQSESSTSAAPFAPCVLLPLLLSSPASFSRAASSKRARSAGCAARMIGNIAAHAHACTRARSRVGRWHWSFICMISHRERTRKRGTRCKFH